MFRHIPRRSNPKTKQSLADSVLWYMLRTGWDCLWAKKETATVEIQPFRRYPLGILKGQFKSQVGSNLMMNLNLSV